MGTPKKGPLILGDSQECLGPKLGQPGNMLYVSYILGFRVKLLEGGYIGDYIGFRV